MSDSLLERYTGRKPEERPGEHASPDADSLGERTAGGGDAADDLGAFGWLRGIRDRAIMLELRRADGTIMAVGYGWLERAEFDPSVGITLHVMGRTIRIKGRNLNAESRPAAGLFEGIVRHRVPWLRQAGEPEAMEAGDTATVIEAIEW